MTTLWYALSAAVVLLLPGLAFLAWARPGRRDLFVILADAVGISIATATLSAMAQFFAGFHFTGAAVLMLYGLCLTALAAGLLRRGVEWPSSRLVISRAAWVLAGLAFFLALAAWRFTQARGLALPTWVDPVHHTLITRVIYEYGGIAPNFEPYLPAAFYYHYGFHLMAALFMLLSRLPAHDSILWFGQVLNAAAALSVYRAAYTLLAAPVGEQEAQKASNQRQAVLVGITAALLVGFVFQMPAYYLTWGRYTLLTGLLLLGPALAAAWEGWHAPRRTSAWLRLALLLAGMALTHYFVVILTGLFLLVLFSWGALRAVRSAGARAKLVRLVAWSAMGIVLVSPWLLRVILANTESAGIRFVSPLAQDEAAWSGAVTYLKYIFYLVGPKHNHILMGMAGVGLLAALLRPQLRLFAAWSALLVLLSLPWGVRFNLVRPDYFAIILFFPAAVLLANLLVSGSAALGSVAAKAGADWPGRLQLAALTAVLVLFLAWGMRETRSIVNPVTIFATPADVAALNWVEQNTPPDARFFINSIFWMEGLDRGVDGGYWLLPYTGRKTVLPPVLYVWGSETYIQQVRDQVARAQKITGCGPDFWGLVRDANLTHIYLRQGTGNLQPEMLQDCPRLDVRYQKDGVFIYEILRP